MGGGGRVVVGGVGGVFVPITTSTYDRLPAGTLAGGAAQSLHVDADQHVLCHHYWHEWKCKTNVVLQTWVLALSHPPNLPHG